MATPTIDAENSQEHDLYIRALRQLDAANQEPEYSVPAQTPIEREFMRNTNRLRSRTLFPTTYQPGQFEQIFLKG